MKHTLSVLLLVSGFFTVVLVRPDALAAHRPFRNDAEAGLLQVTADYDSGYGAGYLQILGTMPKHLDFHAQTFHLEPGHLGGGDVVAGQCRTMFFCRPVVLGLETGQFAADFPAVHAG